MTRYLAEGRDVWKSGFVVARFPGEPGVAEPMAQEYADWQNSKLPPERYVAEFREIDDWWVVKERDETAGRLCIVASRLTEVQARAVAKRLNEMEEAE